MFNNAECPYCGHGVEINHDDGYGYKQDETYEDECDHCGNIFVYSVDWSITYYTEKAPCLNGEEHKMKDVVYFPKREDEIWKRCEYCGKEDRRMNLDGEKV